MARRRENWYWNLPQDGSRKRRIATSYSIDLEFQIEAIRYVGSSRHQGTVHTLQSNTDTSTYLGRSGKFAQIRLVGDEHGVLKDPEQLRWKCRRV